MKKPLVATLLPIGALAAGAPPPSIAARTRPVLPSSGSALAPPSSGGLVVLDSLLKKLTTHRRLMIVGAHPDDENTALLTLVSRRLGGEAAYLSLSRGEGGQNLIGPELGIGLGLIRSQELVAARQLDGGHQFFTRAYDFGYTRSIEETLTKWPREALLEDAVRIVRRFRPQVIYSIFTGTGRDGHGQHHAAGMVAAEAYRLAGDAAFLPHLSEEELSPWRPRALYRSDWFEEEGQQRVRLPTGEVDPLTGRSYHQIAMASRSLHRSQDMGRLQDPGPNQTGAVWIAGAGGNGSDDVFAGIDTRLRAIAEDVPEPGRSRAQARLDRAQALAEEARRGLSPARLEASVRPVEAILAELQAAREGFPAESADVTVLDEKIAVAQGALAAAAGVALDATSSRETTAPAESVETVVRVWNSGIRAVTVEDVSLVSFEGWQVNGKTDAREVAGGGLREWKLLASPPAGAPPTVPYFLVKPLQGALYDWSGVPPEVRGEPFQPPPLTAVVRLRVGGTSLTLTRDVVYRYRDQAIGEIRRPLRTVPLLDVSVTPDLLVWPLGRRTHRLEVDVASNSASPVSGRLELAAPAGWQASASPPFQFERTGDRKIFDATITAPARPRPGRFSIEVAARRNAAAREALDIRLIDYPHIPPTPMPREASVELRAADIRLPSLRRVGYVRGAADRVPEFLRSVGVPVEILGERDLASGDLSRFDAIVIGSRAYETDAALARANDRVLDYARRGGLLIVQYQQYPFIEGGFAPYRLEIGRPHDRITDEASPVKILQPSHPIFRHPNATGEEDWAGWVQERGLYFPKSWDPAYTPLLAMTDPGMPEQRGGLLVARLGRGRYVYTGLAFFRQIPAGVPGAYRLFANLLAWRADAR